MAADIGSTGPEGTGTCPRVTAVKAGRVTAPVWGDPGRSIPPGGCASVSLAATRIFGGFFGF